jgi:hypothetical protein
MKQVIRDAKYCPQALDSPISRVTPQGAVPVAKPAGERWVEAQALRTPETASTDAAIRRLVDHSLPHQPGNPEYRGAVAEATYARAVAEAKAAAPEAAPISAEPEPVTQAPAPVQAATVPEPAAVVAHAAVAGGTLTRRRLA